MDKKITFLEPINIKEPPAHTQIYPRCFTCSHFPTCNIRSDYLKTLFLIQNVLGDPQDDLCLCKSNPHKYYPYYEGTPIENADTIFPAEISFTKRELPTGETLTETVKGNLESAKYQDFDTVLFIYNAEGYKVMFKALYNSTNKEYDIYDGYDIIYKIKYEFPESEVLSLQVNLNTWRNDMIEKEEKELDIINTTHFSALLNCDFFDPVKGLTPEEGVKRIIAQYPDGIPCGNGKYYHLETLHVEPHRVPWYNPNAGKIAFAPAAFPVFVPVHCKKKMPPRRRDDIND